MSEQAPPPPRGLRKSGKAVWNSVLSSLELDEQELRLLLEAARCADRLDALDRAIHRRGHIMPDGRVSPALAEARQQQITLARLVAALRLPEDLSAPERRPQRRSARGVYRPRLSLVREEAP